MFYLVLNIISWQFPFFWDTLLTSTICSEFINNGFNGGIPPNDLDAGHPPLFYAYIYLLWSAISQTLMTSHLAILPFLWVMVYQFIRICERILTNKTQVIAATTLFCLETTILAQSILVSYDIVLLAFYLFGLRYLLDRKLVSVSIAGIVLCLISLRGVVAFGALFLTDIILFKKDNDLKKIMAKYSPALLIFIGWNIFHYSQSGWMLFSNSEQWADQRGFASVSGSFKNVVVIIRNLIEPGRLLLYVFLFLGLILNFRKVNRAQFKKILIILFIPLFAFSALFIPFNNPIGHRYLMIIFALSIPLLVFVLQPFKFKKLALILVGACLISGHFWYNFYPDHISKGWDSSLAHIPYFKVQHETLDYLQIKNIPIDKTSAHFPLDVSINQSCLANDTLKPVQFEKGIGSYVLVSNINNDFSSEDLLEINSACKRMKRISSLGTYIDVYDCSRD